MATAIGRMSAGVGRRTILAALVGLLLGGVAGAMITQVLRSGGGGEAADRAAAITVPEASALTRGQAVDALRYQGMAEAHRTAEQASLRGRAADGARYQSLAGALGATLLRQGLTRGQAADALRYQKLAERLGG